MDSQILSLHAKGMTTREIVATFKEMYDTDVSPTLISKVTDAVKEQVTEWQNRPLDPLYPIVYIDCIVVKVRHGGSVINKAVTGGLKAVYQAPTEEAAIMALDMFAGAWDDKYPQISKSCQAHWENLNTLFGYPPDIRKAIYTTNAIESLNSVIRAAIKKRKVFPTDDSVRKVIYLAIKDASKK